MREPQDACMPRTQILSLIAMGIPFRAECADVPSAALSISSARCSAASRLISRNALSWSLSFSADARADSVRLRAEVAPPASASVISGIVFMKPALAVRGNGLTPDPAPARARSFGQAKAALRQDAMTRSVRPQALIHPAQAQPHWCQSR